MWGELADADFDQAIACGDCDEADPEVYPCGCEQCANLEDDDCDSFIDAADLDCAENPSCIVVTSASPDPDLQVERDVCGAAEVSGPFEVIRGFADSLQVSGGSVDLGAVECVDGNLVWDRTTEYSKDPNPACNDPVVFYLARDHGAFDFGSAYPGGEPREQMSPVPVCP